MIFDLSAYINESQWGLCTKFENMKLLVLTFLNFSLGKTISGLPEKLILYQNITGIDDQTVWKIFNDQTLGKKARIEQFLRHFFGWQIAVLLQTLRCRKTYFRIIRQYLSKISVYRFSTRGGYRSGCLEYRETKCWCCCQRGRFLMFETWVLSFHRIHDSFCSSQLSYLTYST